MQSKWKWWHKHVIIEYSHL